MTEYLDRLIAAIAHEDACRQTGSPALEEATEATLGAIREAREAADRAARAMACLGKAVDIIHTQLLPHAERLQDLRWGTIDSTLKEAVNLLRQGKATQQQREARLADWRYAVANGDTIRGFEAWLYTNP